MTAVEEAVRKRIDDASKVVDDSAAVQKMRKQIATMQNVTTTYREHISSLPFQEVKCKAKLGGIPKTWAKSDICNNEIQSFP